MTTNLSSRKKVFIDDHQPQHQGLQSGSRFAAESLLVESSSWVAKKVSGVNVYCKNLLVYEVQACFGVEGVLV